MQTLLPSGPVKSQYTGDGTKTVFEFNVDITDNSVIRVYLNNVESSSGWTYSEEGKSVTFTTAPAAGTSIVIMRYAPAAYTESITDKGIISPETLDNMAVELTAQIQTLEEKLSRAPVFPVDTDRTGEEIYNDFKQMESSTVSAAAESTAAVQDVKELRDESLNSLNTAVETAKQTIGSYTNNMVGTVEDATAGYINQAKTWATGEIDEVAELQPGERSSRGYADVSAAYASTPEDVPIEDSDILALEIFKGDKGDPGNDGLPGGGWELFDHKSSDHLINNYGWVRSNLQWCYGSMYQSGYNHLIETSDAIAYTKKYYQVNNGSVKYLINYTKTQLQALVDDIRVSEKEKVVALYTYQNNSGPLPVVYQYNKARDILNDANFTWPNGSTETFTRSTKYSEISYLDRYKDGYNFTNQKAMIKRDGWARFGTTSIITLPIGVPQATGTNDNWTFFTHFKTGSDISARQVILNMQYNGTADYGLILDIYSSKINIYVSSNGTSWDVISNVSGTTTLTINTEYYLKLERYYVASGNAGYRVYLSRDGVTWSTEINQVKDAGILAGNKPGTVVIGNKTSDMARYFRGYIDLSESRFEHKLPQYNWEPYHWVDVNYYQNSEGRKICLSGQEDNLRKVIQLSGQAWYYILDRSNERFKLPYSENFERFGTKNIGNYQEDMSQDFAVFCEGADNYYAGYPRMMNLTGNIIFPEKNYTGMAEVIPYSSNENVAWDRLEGRMSNKYNAGDQVSPRATLFYLYFYLGEVTASSASVDLNGLSETVADKMDNDFGNATVGFDPVIDYYPKTDAEKTAEANAGTYRWWRKYRSGWIEQGGFIDTVSENSTTTIEFLKNFNNKKYFVSLLEVKNKDTSNNGSTNANAISQQDTYRMVIITYSWDNGRLWEAKGWGADE